MPRSPFLKSPLPQHPAFSLPEIEDSVDALVNEVIDAEGEGRSAEALAAIRRGRRHPGFGVRLAAMRATMRTVAPSEAPLCDREDERAQRHDVLAEVNMYRPFLSRRLRRQVSASRLAVAAAFVVTSSLVMLAQWAYPARSSGFKPASHAAASAKADLAAVPHSLSSMMNELAAVVPPPSPAAAPLPLYPGGCRAHETSPCMADAGGIPSPSEFASTMGACGPTRSVVAKRSTGPVAAPAPDTLPPVPLLLQGGHTGNASVLSSQPLAGLFRVDADGVIHFAPDVPSDDRAPRMWK